MARRNQQTFAKRQRQIKKAEKAAEKRARRAAAKDPQNESDDNLSDDGAPLEESDADVSEQTPE